MQEPNQEPNQSNREGWEVVEEIDTETPEPAAELENLPSLDDNSPEPSTEEPITMPHTHTQDYAEQNLDQGEYYQYPKSPRKIPYLLIGGIALGIVGLILAAKFIFFKGESETKPPTTDILIESTSGSPTPSPEVSPSPAPEAVDKEDLKIQVLNGSGVVGAAGKLATLLKEADYTKVDTSNASSYDAEGVKIQVKDGQMALGEDIKKILDSDYEDMSVRDNLDEDSDYDMVITLGKQPGDVQGASDSADLKQASDKKD